MILMRILVGIAEENSIQLINRYGVTKVRSLSMYSINDLKNPGVTLFNSYNEQLFRQKF